jgi:multidrug efflux pump subunit AcrA (membrane-fusion protein)
MNHKRPPLPAIVVIAVLVIIGIYFVASQILNQDNGQIAASGTIEATQVNIAPELAGKVVDILVEEGQPVRMDDPLLRLDPSLLTAQRQVAESGLASARNALLTAHSAQSLAQAQYDAALIAARAQQGSARLSDWLYRAPSQFDQPLWYFSQAEQIVAAQAEVMVASQDLVKVQGELEDVIQDLKNADFVKAEKRLAEARVGYLVAKAVYDRSQVTGGTVSPEDIEIKMPPHFSTYRTKIEIAKNLSSDSDVVTATQDSLDLAEAELDEAQKAYDDLLDTDAAEAVLTARAVLSVARERYEVALDTLTRLQTGEYAPQVKIAAAALEQATAVLGQAEGAVQQAEANLALIDTQMSKLTITAPMDGVILTRNAEVGVFLQPGATAFVIGELGDLTITVYIPEDRYGQITLKQQAAVTVDSFPGLTFIATVIQISDKAEFTPRNVQTVEGRSSTVYAIKLSVVDPDGKLKIGMPADVVFSE